MANDSREQLQITSRTKVDDIRRAAGFTDVGWRMFLGLTGEQAKKLVTESEQSPASWSGVDYSQKTTMLAEVNEELERQGLPTVGEDVYHRRRAQATPPLIRQLKAGKKGDNHSVVEGKAQDGSTGAPLSSLRAASPEGYVVLPPIRTQPNLAQHLDQVTAQGLPAEEDCDQPGHPRAV